MDRCKCKNKKCQRPLPEGYKHKYCESCRNRQVKHLKNAGSALLSFVGAVGTVIIAITSKGEKS